MWKRLQEIEERYEELQRDYENPEIVADPANIQRIGKLSAELEPIVRAYKELKSLQKALDDAESALSDPELKELAQEEIPCLKEQIENKEQALKLMLLPKDPNDEKSVIIEIKPGTGGDEAGLFAAELLRMYARFAERKGWKYEILDKLETGINGISYASMSVNAPGAYSVLKHETGVHRVQRVPKTEAQGRIHTSAASVVVMPEIEEVDIDIKPEELEIDTFRSSSAGGQHVNKTESAVRIKHKPSGIIVSCQDERSQIQNRERAMRMLRTKLYDLREQERMAEQGAARRAAGGGDRSEKIRTYNFPQSRVTDHRIKVDMHSLQAFLDGELDEMLDALTQDEQMRKLAEHVSQNGD